uniref:transmembrane emp24 domain-containing protein 10-like n=1 Tax=Myxine glutinosa TaxID=7769 RepID=UPI00358FFFC8
MPQWTTLCALLAIVLPKVSSISFTLSSNTEKCLIDDVLPNLLVAGEYSVLEHPVYPIENTLKITDDNNNILFTHKDSHGKFSFTSDRTSAVFICFSSKVEIPMGTFLPDQLVHLTLKHGVEAKYYKEIAHMQKLKPLETKVQQLTEVAKELQDYFEQMQTRRRERRGSNEFTNFWLLNMGFFSSVCAVLFALFQVVFLRRYFRTHKLID